MKPLPCPFCGNREIDQDAHMIVEHHGKDGAAIYCGQCGASGPEAADVADAARQWNSRPTLDEALAIARELARLARCMDAPALGSIGTQVALLEDLERRVGVRA